MNLKFFQSKNFHGGSGDKRNSTIDVTTSHNYSIVVGKDRNGISVIGFDLGTAGTGSSSSFNDIIIATGGTGARSYKNGTETTFSNGINAGNGEGGIGRSGNSLGANGWVIIEYGEGIEP